jgi:hypothetical protein
MGGGAAMSNFYYRVGDDQLNGPHESVAAIRSEVLENAHTIFNDSCSCLKSGDTTNWFERVEVFRLVTVFQPIVKAKITLKEVQP